MLRCWSCSGEGLIVSNLYNAFKDFYLADDAAALIERARRAKQIHQSMRETLNNGKRLDERLSALRLWLVDLLFFARHVQEDDNSLVSSVWQGPTMTVEANSIATEMFMVQYHIAIVTRNIGVMAMSRKERLNALVTASQMFSALAQQSAIVDCKSHSHWAKALAQEVLYIQACEENANHTLLSKLAAWIAQELQNASPASPKVIACQEKAFLAAAHRHMGEALMDQAKYKLEGYGEAVAHLRLAKQCGSAAREAKKAIPEEIFHNFEWFKQTITIAINRSEEEDKENSLVYRESVPQNVTILPKLCAIPEQQTDLVDLFLKDRSSVLQTYIRIDIKNALHGPYVE